MDDPLEADTPPVALFLLHDDGPIRAWSDLLDAFIPSDAEIRGEAEHDVLGHILGPGASTVAVEVRGGVVTLRGHVPGTRRTGGGGLCHGVDVYPRRVFDRSPPTFAGVASRPSRQRRKKA
jgi:hypothetical protein